MGNCWLPFAANHFKLTARVYYLLAPGRRLATRLVKRTLHSIARAAARLRFVRWRTGGHLDINNMSAPLPQ